MCTRVALKMRRRRRRRHYTTIMMSDITSLMFTAHDHILGFMIRNGYMLKIYEKQRLLIAMRPKMRFSDVLTLYSGLQRSHSFLYESVRIHGQRIVGKIDAALTCI